MRLIGSAACVLASVFVVACQSQQPAPPPSPTVSQDQYATIRDAIAKANPNWTVGRVGYVLPDQSLFTVVDIPAHSAQVGDVFTVKDANGNSIADGTVVNVDAAGTMVAVHYDLKGNLRAPMAGDVVIHIPLNR